MLTLHAPSMIQEFLETAARYQSAFQPALTDDELRTRVPAVFAEGASAHLKETYRFISTTRVVAALRDAGFSPVYARQTRSRNGGAVFARHLVRFRRRLETVEIGDAVPEIVLLNAHDGTAAYQLRAGLYRPVCKNGLMVSMGDFAAVYVPHRGDVLDRVVIGALEVSERFGALGAIVERMMQRRLEAPEQTAFAERALALRFEPDEQRGMQASQLLMPKRDTDVGDDLWSLYNVAQEWLLRGGLKRTSATGRQLRTRRIRAIREDVRLNTGLWELASSYLAA